VNDTDPEVATLVRERMMRLTGEERVLMAASMFESARQLVLSSLQPDLCEDERRRALCQRLYGIELPKTY
jgi:hypothetical protein